MLKSIEERAIKLGEYIVSNQATVRDAALTFKIPKSTVYDDVASRLEKIDKELAKGVRRVMEINKIERVSRGGKAAQENVRRLKSNKKAS